MPSPASSLAKVTAMVVRPGAPVGPQMATTRPYGGVDTDLVDRVARTLRTAAIEVCRRCGRRGGSGHTLRSLVAGQVIGEVISEVEVALEGQEGLVDRRGGLGECGLEVRELDAAGDDAADAELTQSSFGVLVTVRSDPDDVHAGRPQLGDRR